MNKSDYYIQDNADIETQKTEAAQGLYKAGDYKGALRLYLDMQNASTSYKLYYEIGRCYYKLNDTENAELNFMHSVSLEDYKNPSYIFLGNIFHKKQNLRKAIEYWMFAYSYKPDDSNVCVNLASSYFALDMRLQAVYYYEKYLKHAKDKNTESYKEVKRSIEEFNSLGQDFYRKALRALGEGDNKTALQALEYAVKNIPTNFDVNMLLGRLYSEEKNYEESKEFLLQAFCLDTKSIDILQKLSAVMLNSGDYTGAYCALKRTLPLVINNQKMYLDITKAIQQLETRLAGFSNLTRQDFAEMYYNKNNYRLALFEYENCVILNPELMEKYENIIDRLKSFINPEADIIKVCLNKGGYLYSNGDYNQSNKYFSKIMKLANESSFEYKFAKSRIVNV